MRYKCAFYFAIAWISARFVALPADVDEDGLDDAEEIELLNQFAPEYFFDSEEHTKPATARWFIERSQFYFKRLLPPPNNGIEIVPLATQAELATSPEVLLRARVDSISSSYVTTQAKTNFVIGLVDDAYGYGQSWEEFAETGHLGLYGHVVPATPDNSQVIIQYWQFFAYNDYSAPLGVGDHQGDWTYLEALVIRQGRKLVRLVYHHHGDDFCKPTVIEKDFQPGCRPSCYLEVGAHEWWPSPGEGGECPIEILGIPAGSASLRHDGRGRHFQTHDIPNLGEIFAPMPDDSMNEIILHFNGLWGDPEGLAVRGPAWPRPLAVYGAYVDSRAPAWDGEGLGSRYHPFQTLAAATAVVQPGGRVHLATTAHPGAVTLSKPMTLVAWGEGSATVGN
jgi:hypothetical protein